MGERATSDRNMMVIFLLLLCVACNALQIETTFKPDECTKTVAKGNQLKMHYTGTIDQSSTTGVKGKKFDSSLDRGTPFEFQIGTGQVIKGWEEGLIGMCIGEKRTLVIPPEKGYGERGAGADIPGGATLNFEVECLDIQDGPPTPNIFADLDKDGSKDLSLEEIQAFFKEQGREMPPDLMEHEDKNGDGVISWTEFSGPKGDEEP